jgi:hypothetical protein
VSFQRGDWTVQIVGGTIAAIIAGLVLWLITAAGHNSAASGHTSTPPPGSNGASGPATPTHSKIAAPPSNGVQLGSYGIDLTLGYAVPLAAAKPVQSQFNVNATGDIEALPDGLAFGPIAPDKIVSLPGGTTPTYQACTSSTNFVNQAGGAPGTAFCVIETGKMAGVTVIANESSYGVLHVIVWQDTNAS